MSFLIKGCSDETVPDIIGTTISVHLLSLFSLIRTNGIKRTSTPGRSFSYMEGVAKRGFTENEGRESDVSGAGDTKSEAESPIAEFSKIRKKISPRTEVGIKRTVVLGTEAIE